MSIEKIDRLLQSVYTTLSEIKMMIRVIFQGMSYGVVLAVLLAGQIYWAMRIAQQTDLTMKTDYTAMLMFTAVIFFYTCWRLADWVYGLLLLIVGMVATSILQAPASTEYRLGLLAALLVVTIFSVFLHAGVMHLHKKWDEEEKEDGRRFWTMIENALREKIIIRFGKQKVKRQPQNQVTVHDFDQQAQESALKLQVSEHPQIEVEAQNQRNLVQG